VFNLLQLMMVAHCWVLRLCQGLSLQGVAPTCTAAHLHPASAEHYVATLRQHLALQAQGVGGRPIKYSGMTDVFAQTIRKEGVRGLYKVGVPARRASSSGNGSCTGKCSSSVAAKPRHVHVCSVWSCCRKVAGGALLQRTMCPTDHNMPAAINSASLLHLVLLSFLQGILPNLVKLAPAAGLSWYVFEGTKKLLGVDPRS
jgi:hypothetical protein